MWNFLCSRFESKNNIDQRRGAMMSFLVNLRFYEDKQNPFIKFLSSFMVELSNETFWQLYADCDLWHRMWFNILIWVGVISNGCGFVTYNLVYYIHLGGNNILWLCKLLWWAFLLREIINQWRRAMMSFLVNLKCVLWG